MRSKWFIRALPLDYLMLVEISIADFLYVLDCAVNVSTNDVVYLGNIGSFGVHDKT